MERSGFSMFDDPALRDRAAREGKTMNEVRRERDKSPWPGAIMFIAFLAFIYKMTELFVR